MKKIIFTIIFSISSIFVFSQTTKTRDFFSTPYDYFVETIEFTVLDINFDNNLVAFKHVFNLQPAYDYENEKMQQACDCKYAGMQEYPHAGVVLGVYDLSKQEYLKIFTIYKATFDENECYDYQLSNKKLDSAKKFFNNHDLDISKHPKPVFIIPKDTTTPVFGADKFSFVFNDINFTYTNKNTYDDNDYAVDTSKLYANDNLIYTIVQQDDFSMSSFGKISYLIVYQQDNEFILLNVFHYTNKDALSASTEFYHFSPVFDLDSI